MVDNASSKNKKWVWQYWIKCLYKEQDYTEK